MDYSKMSVTDLIKYNEQVLDSIDLSPYLKRNEGNNIYDFMKDVERDFDCTDMTKNPILDCCIFNQMGKWEVQEYINNRYKGQYKAEEVDDIPIYIYKCK